MDLKKTKTSSKLSNRQELLLDKLNIFYTQDNINQLLPILNGETKLSLRIIDWFVTNYTKKNNIILYKKKKVIKKSPKSKIEQKTKKTKYEYVNEQVNIYLNYKNQLKAYSKKNFDPFCRRERINFFYNDTKHITTVGQLNFFKWALENNVIDYIKENLDKIDKDMNINIKRDDDILKLTKSKSKSFKKNNIKKDVIDEDDINLTSINLDTPSELPPIGDTNYKQMRRKRRELSCSANNNLNKHKFSITLEFE
jgi:hypothetical protein